MKPLPAINFLIGSLRGRLIVGVALATAVVMTIFIADQALRQRAMLLERQEDEARVLANTLAISAAVWLESADLAGLQELVEAQAVYPELAFAILTDKTGKIFAHTDRTLRGRYLTDLPDSAGRTVIARSHALVDVAVPAILGGRTVGWARVGVGQKKAGKELAEITLLGGLYAAAAIVLVSIIAWFLGIGLTRRLYAVQKTMDAVRKGDGAARSRVAGNDEAAQLSREFDDLLDVLAEHERDLSTTQDALRRNEEKYRLIADNANDWIYLISPAPTGNIVYTSPSCERVTGYKPDDFINDPQLIRTIVHPEDRVAFELHYDGRLADSAAHNIEFRIITKLGDVRWINHFCTPVVAPDGSLAGRRGTNHDITARKRAEEELQSYKDHLEDLVKERSAALVASEEKFKTVADFTYDWEYWIAPDKKVIYTSPSCERITGNPPKAFYEDRSLIESIVHPEDRTMFAEHVSAYHVGPSVKEVTEIEFRIIAKDGTEKWIGHVCRPILDEAEVYKGRRISNRDITQKKNAENVVLHLNRDLAAKSANLEAVNKELEAFSYSVSHDLKAPLRSVDGFAKMLEEDYADRLDDEGRRILKVVRDSAKEMGQLISDLLTFSRLSRKEMKFSRLNFGFLIEEARRRAEQAAPGRTIRWDVGELPSAFGDEATLREVWVNLLSNAVKYTRPRNEATISVHGTITGDEVVYSVADNGVGFDMAYKDKLFCVFQRLHTADEFEGTGIGLALVQRIVQRHGGRVWARGELDKGATFCFTLPLTIENETKERKVGYE
jgi:PAS domain S-box-containing protein